MQPACRLHVDRIFIARMQHAYDGMQDAAGCSRLRASCGQPACRAHASLVWTRHYRALESVSIASALSTALTIYPRQIRVHQRWQSKLQLPTAQKKEWRPATADSLPQAVTCQHCDTHYFSRPRTHNLPIVGPTRCQYHRAHQTTVYKLVEG